jgi:hypothetical protein
MGHSRTRRIPSSGRFASFEIKIREIRVKLLPRLRLLEELEELFQGRRQQQVARRRMFTCFIRSKIALRIVVVHDHRASNANEWSLPHGKG